MSISKYMTTLLMFIFHSFMFGCGTTQKEATFKIPNSNTDVLVGAAILGMMQEGYEFTFDQSNGRISSPILSAGSQNEVQYNIVATSLANELEITTTVVDEKGKIDDHVPKYTKKFKSIVDDIIRYMNNDALAYIAQMNRDGSWVKLDGMIRIGPNVEQGCESLGTIAVPVTKTIAAPLYFKQINFAGIADKVARVITLQKGGNFFQSAASNIDLSGGFANSSTEQKLHGTAYKCPDSVPATQTSNQTQSTGTSDQTQLSN